ncbi:MAG: dienelactone hydrolase family protein [Clostridia bacterium]|nr:dienelactone hydrolase family protein [Clostridia bacterium]
MKKLLSLLLLLCTLFVCACAPTEQPTASPEGTQGSTETQGTAEVPEPTPAPTMLPTDESLPASQQIENGFINATNTTPEFHEMPDFAPTGQFAGIKAGWFEGMSKNGKRTKVFAYIGFPKDASADSKVPAIVLNHGGGGHAFLQWVKMWNDRGYAAIAIDNTGYFPTKVNAGSTEINGDWRFGIPRDLKEDGFINAPNNDGMGSSRGKVTNMWMYHAVGQTILASNILRADERVDGSKVGVTGISWGGVITSIVIGYDTRFAFAIPIYGSGYLDESLAWMKDNFGGAQTKELWLAQDNFDKADMPVLWLCWNDDTCFSINSNSKSYLDTVKNNPDTRLSMINKMYHSHSSGWAPGESMLFADSIVKGGAKLADFTSQPTGKSINATLSIDPSATAISATLYYITADMTYSKYDKHGYGYADTAMDQVWQTKALTIEDGKVIGDVPADAKGYYIELKTTIGGKQYVSCSAWITDVN